MGMTTTTEQATEAVTATTARALRRVRQVYGCADAGDVDAARVLEDLLVAGATASLADADRVIAEAVRRAHDPDCAADLRGESTDARPGN